MTSNQTAVIVFWAAAMACLGWYARPTHTASDQDRETALLEVDKAMDAAGIARSPFSLLEQVGDDEWVDELPWVHRNFDKFEGWQLCSEEAGGCGDASEWRACALKYTEDKANGIQPAKDCRGEWATFVARVRGVGSGVVEATEEQVLFSGGEAIETGPDMTWNSDAETLTWNGVEITDPRADEAQTLVSGEAVETGPQIIWNPNIAVTTEPGLVFRHGAQVMELTYKFHTERSNWQQLEELIACAEVCSEALPGELGP
ncbi:MAG: hypothetical protein V3V08_05600 [Nannocystaceae bacterium]